MRYTTLPDGRHAWMVKTETRPGDPKLFTNYEGDDRAVPFTESEEFAFAHGKHEAINARAFADFQARARMEEQRQAARHASHSPEDYAGYEPRRPSRWQQFAGGFRSMLRWRPIAWDVVGMYIAFVGMIGLVGLLTWLGQVIYTYAHGHL